MKSSDYRRYINDMLKQINNIKILKAIYEFVSSKYNR